VVVSSTSIVSEGTVKTDDKFGKMAAAVRECVRWTRKQKKN